MSGFWSIYLNFSPDVLPWITKKHSRKRVSEVLSFEEQILTMMSE